MDIELGVLMGHPDHDLLFIANQAAYAAGLKDPSHKARDVAKRLPAFRVREVLGESYLLMKPAGMHPPTWNKMWLMPEPSLYEMLLRGHALSLSASASGSPKRFSQASARRARTVPLSRPIRYGRVEGPSW